ncbi:similar to Saccharomyces cerevisiae YDR316W OMS1 Protein integral to the mitochondrial membrane [Maudiozyma barnettii]|uniref:Similar to Saccharomyces cerevisiae YDR316W OMS1 Protein integral to the mitochondrial membrane n=1 Tax=Maudiozyma barnettii TaxID=61262 RepID=A0A8H2VE51_9SACH|nr:putative RNA methyltransferase [Kazachstania barnettii]CAB4253810.1 similar to Saccharomyces cerevisiae YDR316W OMS1 Protein integral to the mitochondrial membrane [Kazachstania barnettii]CAD1781559.1 similar to Saccharomyces cerevisiae YDR316W OMS1 Protein integral to the mitochondrial membrane [Kazachstania barnettii]
MLSISWLALQSIKIRHPIILGTSIRSISYGRIIYQNSKKTFIRSPAQPVYSSSQKSKKPKTKEDLARERFETQINSKNWFVRWGAKLRSDEFSKGMTKYMIGAYIIFLIYGYYFMKKLYIKENELKDLIKKQDEGKTNEYENIRIKELNGKMRTRDKLKLDQYEEMKKSGIENFDGYELEITDQNKLNKAILPAHDTTPFYDSKAEDYDNDINMEERVIGMGRRRKWLMKHCKGDVLEVSCGTGRNIKYLDPEHINSITFLDSSEPMMEVSHKKFRDKFPTYKKAAFVVGRAEDLNKLAKQTDKDGNKKDVKYDTVIETFGLCSHEDPVSALNNFANLLKPEGRIVLLEHGRGDYDIINKILDKRAKRRLDTWGCRWNLDIGEILDDSGLEIVDEKTYHLGTTWCIVAKKKGDIKRKDEIGFFEKYVGSSIKQRIDSFEEVDNTIDSSSRVQKNPSDTEIDSK